MKTTIGVLGLLVVLAIVGIFATSNLHQLEIAAGGSSAVIYAATSSAVSPPQRPQNQQHLEHTVEGAVPQGRPEPDDK